MGSKYGIYKGDSDGFSSISDGYVDYAKEVIANRSIPDLRDGLKPVARRIIYTAHENKTNALRKCSAIVSDALKLHPHGDQSVYGAFCLLTDENGSCNIPYFQGLGNLGRVYSSKKPAAMRYPKAMINENAEDFFVDKAVMDLYPAEEGDGKEPKVLNAIYPTILVNGTMGMAVSVSTMIPSFNFGEVLDLTIKYLKNGSLSLEDAIAPDFPTGGILVKNDSEIAKVMTTGKGKVKIRAKVEVHGKEIYVKEVPYGKTKESIIKSIKEADLREVTEVMDSTGLNSPALVIIKCRTKNSVDYALMELYRRQILQNVYSSNILVMNENEPLMIGVFDIIEKWVAWRRKIVTQRIQYELEGIRGELDTLGYFIRLISNDEWKNTYVDKVVNVNKKEGDTYLHEIFEDIPQDVCDWINGRAISAFNNGGRYLNRYEDLKDTKSYYERSLKDLDSYIIAQLEELKQKKYGQYERKTEVTYLDYKFSKVEDSVIEDTSYCVYTLLKNGFLKKTRAEISSDEVLCSIPACSNSVLIGFDNYGRVLRVIGSEIPFTGEMENGVYMAKYFDATFQEDYRVLYLGLLDGSRKMLVYRDGYVGFFDTSEWVGKKNIKIISNGVCLAVYDKLLEVVEEKDFPDYLVVADYYAEDKVRFGLARVEDIIVKSRRSRTKVFTGDAVDINFLYGLSNMGIYTYLVQPERFLNKMRVLKDGDLLGDETLMADGRYLGICKDFETQE